MFKPKAAQQHQIRVPALGQAWQWGFHASLPATTPAGQERAEEGAATLWRDVTHSHKQVRITVQGRGPRPQARASH